MAHLCIPLYHILVSAVVVPDFCSAMVDGQPEVDGHSGQVGCLLHGGADSQ